MSDRVQPGVKIDADLWEEFRQDIEARKGAVRGHLRTELENAIREYLHGTSDVEKNIEETLTRLERDVNSRLSTLEAEVGITAADGGADTSEGEPHTRAPTPAPAEQPPPNAPTNQKVEWLAGELIAEVCGDRTKDAPAEVSTDTIREVVKDRYGFRRDTAKRYVAELIDHFGYVDHPWVDVVVCTPERRDELREQRRNYAAEDAAETMDELEEVTADE